MSRLGSAVLVVGLFSWTAAPAGAWNEVGHLIVAKIAYDDLAAENPKMLAHICGWLKKHPHYDAFLGKDRPVGVGEDEWAFLRASIWPDWIRPKHKKGMPDPRGEAVLKYHRSFNHYINFPFVFPDDADLFKDRDLTPPPDKGEILSAYKQAIGELWENEATDDQKAVSLCWILHLVGDVHQPLHCTALYSKKYPDGDKGGNAIEISASVNLHSYWDDLLGDPPGKMDDGPDRQAKVYNAVKATVESLRDPKTGRKALEKELAAGKTILAWAQESFADAQKYTYREGDVFIDFEKPKLSKEYRSTAIDVARRRVALAGYRIADKFRELRKELHLPKE